MATVASNVYFLLLLSLLRERFEAAFANQITLGASLSPTIHPTSWRSSSGRFAFGFYQQGNGFKVGIWLFGDDATNTIVWTSNRDEPPVSSSSRLFLTRNGEILLQIGPRQEKRIAHSDNGTVHSASLLDSGNLVLQDRSSNILWQSFDYPTDTILGGQVLRTGDRLLSSSSNTNQSSGRFQLKMQDDGNLVMYPAYPSTTPSDAYWATMTVNGAGSKFYLSLENTSPYLRILDANRSNTVIWEPNDTDLSTSSSNGNNTIYRAAIDYNGVFRVYAHFDDKNGKRQARSVWSALDVCDVKNFCGFNSYCTYIDDKPFCDCLPGTDYIDQSQNNLGCVRNFSDVGCRNGGDNTDLYSMFGMSSMSWSDAPYFEEPIPEEDCQSSCLKDCYCGAAIYKDERCGKQKLPLRYVRRQTQGSSYTIYFKVGKVSLKSNSTSSFIPEPPIKTTSKKAILLITLLILGFAILLCSAIAISGHLIYRIGILSYKRLLEVGDLGLNEGITLRLFSYNELKKATNGFKQELGKGSFGSVYKGSLDKGRRLIAVKRLEKLVEEGEREFQAEMRAIGKTHHKNLVRLLGYCAEGSKRLLVFEYMSGGSLEKLIFGDSTRRPDWDQRRRIALDIAKGLLYLHEECGAPIIHCDIKPQNILMDEFWTAKISDFGLAKLLMPDQTRTFTVVRGTRGYLAPEWQKNTPITVKTDVYSYGIMLLEILFCRRNMVITVSHPEQVVLSTWVCNCFVRRELKKLVIGEEVDNTLLENMVKVGLWCIQDEPFLRPSMKSVVLMLEGITDVAIPPCPSPDSM
ncbi:G-type lectin S-receptor-like serine/threonine-protein kinase LECRK1 [Neltuma alba]|uniref:G-type lectin S-receptor-like serine/threonine-protein kinase LECRK1 n=1 Tax=Neltuma alba TaxID=207710 RepID=UPI0010A392F2|nr:G-type lectin S-receptor-like serine/threonine-protein kinase LECRK1 [Prosopis alba]